jgi:predicted TIM-barrel fold metal-dependent hydrolase
MAFLSLGFQMQSGPQDLDRRVIVASADTHIGPSLDQLREYCERRYLDAFDSFAGATQVAPGRVAAGLLPSPGEADYSLIVTPGHYDVEERLRQLDQDGVAAEVIFHGSQNGQPLPFSTSAFSFSSLPSSQDGALLELSLAGVQIYNRWLADFCSTEPERHAGMAQLPVWDIEASVAEVKLGAERGLRGVNFPAPRPELPAFNSPHWEPLWSACEDCSMPLNTHGGAGAAVAGVGAGQGPGASHIRHLENVRFSARGLWWLILGGVFDRHERLKFILTEHPGLIASLPVTLRELDEIVEHVSFGPAGLSKRPSEYFMTNCYVGASFMSGGEAHIAMANGLENNVLWGSDYPHMEGTYPWSRLSLRSCLSDLNQDAAASMAGSNLIELFGLDRSKLQAVADRIGPSAGELATPVRAEEIPSVPGRTDFSMAFRRGVVWV